MKELQELVGAKRHFSKLGWIFVAGIAIVYGVQIMLSNGLAVMKPELLYNADFSLFLSMASMYLVGFPLLIMMLKKDVPAEPIEKHKMTAGQYAVAAVICVGIAYASNLLGNIVTLIVGYVKGNPVKNDIAQVAGSVSPWTVLVYMVICAPIMEEYIFRKLIVDRTVRYGQGIAVVTSGLMFGLFHGNLNQFVYAAVIGMFLAYLYVKTGNIKITISLHMLFNFLGGFVSTLLIRLIDLDGYMKIMENGDYAEIRNYFMSHLTGWALYAVFLVCVLGLMVAGVVLFIVFAVKKRFVFEKGRTAIPGELKFNVAMVNSGMLTFEIFWIIMIIRQLLS